MAADIGALTTWSTTAASNQPDATDSVVNIDDNLRQIQAEVRKYAFTKGADIASAATVDLSAATGNYVHVTGTITITALGTVGAGFRFLLVFDGALTFTHNATSLILPTAANITTAAGDRCEVVSLGSGNWRCLWYQRASGGALSIGNAQPLDATLTALAGLATGADMLPYSTGADTFDQTALTAFARTLLDDADAATARTTLGAAATVHSHAGADITSGDIAAARITTALNATGTAPIYACRAWVNFNGTGTVAINASGNVSSITDNGVGNYTVNFTNAMPDANYAFAGEARDDDATTTTIVGQALSLTKNASALQIYTMEINGALIDSNDINVVVFR